MFIKVCGITTKEQIDAAVDMGYSAVGIVFHGKSPRYCAPEKAAALARYAGGRIVTVAVALNYSEISESEHLFDLIQIYEPFSSTRLIAAGASPPANGAVYRYFMHDTSMGSGAAQPFPLYDEKIRERLIISGGLDPGNAASMIKASRPAGVDVSSGVEKNRGIKDMELMESFIREVRCAAG